MSPITKVRVGHEDFDVSAELRALERAERTAGATVSFTGIVRGDDGVRSMTLEYYPGMTEQAIKDIIAVARSRWPVEDVVVIHRVGELKLGEQIVLCLVTAGHRGEAFAACEFIMDWLKTQAPFWKKEDRGGETRWVDARESDDQAAARWGTIPTFSQNKIK